MRLFYDDLQIVIAIEQKIEIGAGRLLQLANGRQFPLDFLHLGPGRVDLIDRDLVVAVEAFSRAKVLLDEPQCILVEADALNSLQVFEIGSLHFLYQFALVNIDRDAISLRQAFLEAVAVEDGIVIKRHCHPEEGLLFGLP